MSHATTISRILKTVGIEPRQVDLVDRVLGMEGDKRVSHVQLHCGTLDSFKLWAEVYIKKQFRSLSEFLKYLGENEIFNCNVWGNFSNNTYTLDSRGVRVEFKEARGYSGK